MSDAYAVFGNPVEHSKSPLIHRLFAEQTGQQMHYDKQLVALDGFVAAVQAFVAAGGKGLNITVPFKEEAYRLADSLSKRARQAGAVNTLLVDGQGQLHGDNTDGVGMLRDITANLGWPVAGKTVLLLGAGGAVRGVLGPLLEQQPARVLLANRTLAKAQHLAQAFSRQGSIEALGFDQLPWHGIDLIINGTSASLAGSVPPIPAACIGANSHCYDMMYGPQLTPFLAWAQQQGCRQLADGLGMLVEQAAEAFFLWRGVRPATAPVIEALRQQQLH
ncbi:MAG TPA: shikimate dehydrogenase [Pseudomonadales bacterium]